MNFFEGVGNFFKALTTPFRFIFDTDFRNGIIKGTSETFSKVEELWNHVLNDDTDAAKDEVETAQTQQYKNFSEYQNKAELAARELSAQQRQGAMQLFQGASQSEAALGASGLEGGTPFWALKQSVNENTQALKEALNQGMLQLQGMQQTTDYNATILENNSSAAERDLYWAPINTAMKGLQTVFSVAGMVSGNPGALLGLTGGLGGGASRADNVPTGAYWGGLSSIFGNGVQSGNAGGHSMSSQGFMGIYGGLNTLGSSSYSTHQGGFNSKSLTYNSSDSPLSWGYTFAKRSHG